ncbi:hypothetical protein CYMTET_7984 [Cymbomonas tetramitiformis]|uniref:MYND-type domain-containing protein n=1 Tax=Cymbomonas tetramitiformis TaxID=36881 RepID=A0AAE0GUG2_9CHLO|nr:hypothetical protein CYMTET_7984 [Cymbomonas tetramitiformis]
MPPSPIDAVSLLGCKRVVRPNDANDEIIQILTVDAPVNLHVAVFAGTDAVASLHELLRYSKNNTDDVCLSVFRGILPCTNSLASRLRNLIDSRFAEIREARCDSVLVERLCGDTGYALLNFVFAGYRTNSEHRYLLCYLLSQYEETCYTAHTVYFGWLQLAAELVDERADITYATFTDVLCETNAQNNDTLAQHAIWYRVMDMFFRNKVLYKRPLWPDGLPDGLNFDCASCWDAVLDQDTAIVRRRSLDVYRVFFLDANLQSIDLQTPMRQWCKLLAELAMCRASIEYGSADDAHDLESLMACHEPIMRICELHRWECDRNSPIDRSMHQTWNDANRLYQIANVVRSCNVVHKRAAQLINAFDTDGNRLNMVISGTVRVDPEVCAFFGLDDTRPMNVAVRWRRNKNGVALGLQHDRVCCVHCGRAAAGDVQLKLCGVCRTVAYCDRACQVRDWNRHREYCVSVRAHVNEDMYAGETVRAHNL